MSSFPCPHEWHVKFADVVAEYMKGTRDEIFVYGNFEECSRCYEGRLVPFNPSLYIVGCTYTPAFKLDKDPKPGLA